MSYFIWTLASLGLEIVLMASVISTFAHPVQRLATLAITALGIGIGIGIVALANSQMALVPFAALNLAAAGGLVLRGAYVHITGFDPAE
ncbi:hypothetical protein LCH21_04730 [Patescibacteria group bacterium]|nr:hypothetical protein [Patescibacteria group bacterium]